MSKDGADQSGSGTPGLTNTLAALRLKSGSRAFSIPAARQNAARRLFMSLAPRVPSRRGNRYGDGSHPFSRALCSAAAFIPERRPTWATMVGYDVPSGRHSRCPTWKIGRWSYH